ncbi:hypothetical protein BC834DRAFT_513957 [Gloeopeniophorella convolvens]|nr:hypothetical protein BC834DRAFT_513957 [Gloeopeniophorella convolvens]
MPVTTRSHSGSLPKRRKSLTEGLEEDEEHDSGVTTFSAKRRKVNGASPPKGISASTAPVAKRKGAPRRRLRGILKNMLTLPLDVLFEIFSGMQPADLLSLARTSKDLRGVLMLRRSTSVWMAARRNVDVASVPDPPEWLSEPAWAHLLFGPRICTACHSNREVLMINFTFFRRYCVSCSLKQFVVPRELQESMPQLKKSVLELIPTDMRSSSLGPLFSVGWLQTDIHEVSRRLSALEEDVASGKSGAQEALETFRSECRRDSPWWHPRYRLRCISVSIFCYLTDVSLLQKAEECIRWKKQVDDSEMRKMYERREA